MDKLLFKNGPIYTMQHPKPVKGVVLTHQDRIAYCGPDEGLAANARRGAEVIDLAGRPLFPGFCDAHLHLYLAAEQFAELDCRQMKSIGELQDFVRKNIANRPAKQWITGFGWQKKYLFATQTPTIEQLDEVAPQNPLLLMSRDMHSAWLNTRAIQQFMALENPPAKCVCQRQHDRWTGLIHEDILELKKRLIPSKSDAERQALLIPYVQHLYANGITAAHSNELIEDLHLAWEYFAGAGPKIRLLWNPIFNSAQELLQQKALFSKHLDRWLYIGGAKLFLDGSFGSLTAAVSRPYNGTQDLGILNMTDEEVGEWLAALHQIGSYGVFHAIGDRAVEQALRCIAQFDWPSKTLHRIEHAQLISRKIIDSYTFHDLVFSGQPSHMPGDRDIVAQHIDAHLAEKFCYAYQTMKKRGGTVVFGSDAPVEATNPWKGIIAAVTRLADQHHPPWIDAEKLTLYEAIAAHTTNLVHLHYGMFDSGTIAQGKLADLVVFEQDPFSVIPQLNDMTLQPIEVAMTFVGGQCVYERPLVAQSA